MRQPQRLRMLRPRHLPHNRLTRRKRDPMSRRDEQGTTRRARTDCNTTNLSIWRNHVLSFYLPVKVAFRDSNRRNITDHARMTGKPAPRRMQDPLTIQQHDIRLCRRSLHQRLHERHLTIRKIRRNERKPRRQRHRLLLNHNPSPIIKNHQRTHALLPLRPRIRHINPSNSLYPSKIILHTNTLSETLLLATQPPQRKLRTKLIEKHPRKIHNAPIPHHNIISLQPTHLILQPKPKPTQPTITMNNLKTRHRLRIRILIHHPTHRPTRNHITKSSSHRPITRHMTSRHLTHQIIRIREKIHKHSRKTTSKNTVKTFPTPLNNTTPPSPNTPTTPPTTMTNTLTFLGTAGARFVVMRQLRASGGLWLHLDHTTLLIDPGPGSLIQTLHHHLDPKTLDAILLTHRHLDHVNDINIMIEAMTNGGYTKHGTIFTPTDALTTDPVIFKHTQQQVQTITTLHPHHNYPIGNLTLTTSQPLHHGVEAYGLTIKGTKTISLITDTEYFPDLTTQFPSDILIVNVVLQEKKDGIHHLSIPEAEEIIKGNHPKLAILTHFGMTLVKADPARHAQDMTTRLGIKVIAATDGLQLPLDEPL